jgi:hypothetical protein
MPLGVLDAEVGSHPECTVSQTLTLNAASASSRRAHPANMRSHRTDSARIAPNLPVGVWSWALAAAGQRALGRARARAVDGVWAIRALDSMQEPPGARECSRILRCRRLSGTPSARAEATRSTERARLGLGWPVAATLSFSAPLLSAGAKALTGLLAGRLSAGGAGIWRGLRSLRYPGSRRL